MDDDRSKINLGLIIEGCRVKNPNSQSKLYEYFYGYGMNIALRYTRKNRDAEEIFNDAFLSIFENIDRYDNQYPFKPWLRKIITYTAIDYFRKYEKNKITFSVKDLPEISVNDIDLVIDQQADLLPILQQLSPMYRMVFNLYVMEEYKHAEIAELLQISVGTSKSNLARAKMRLKALWLENKKNLTKPSNTKTNG